jgi:ADP-ribosylglycohydrolase
MIKMLGAIAGDVIGSIYEHRPIKTKEFPLFQGLSRFTDDTVLTVAIADAILESRSYLEILKIYTRKYPNAGYGSHFWQWAHSERQEPYNSWGNGSAMRVSPVGYAFDSIERVLEEAERSAAVTHNHPEGVKGAQAVALAVYLARQDASMDDIRSELQTRFGYDLDRRLEQIRPDYHFDVSCQGSVPEAIISFLESSNYEDAIRNAISLGGDSDTLACISGGIASAFYGGVPGSIVDQVRRRLPGEFLEVIDRFNRQYSKPKT